MIFLNLTLEDGSCPLDSSPLKTYFDSDLIFRGAHGSVLWFTTWRMCGSECGRWNTLLYRAKR